VSRAAVGIDGNRLRKKRGESEKKEKGKKGLSHSGRFVLKNIGSKSTTKVGSVQAAPLP